MSRLEGRVVGMLGLVLMLRRAPEHKFPTPMNDCFDVLQWVGIVSILTRKITMLTVG